MHDIAMAALSVFLMQSLALLASVPTRPACRSAPLGARASRPHPAGGRQWTTRRRPTRVFKRARCLLAGCFSGCQGKSQFPLNTLINIMLSTLFRARHRIGAVMKWAVAQGYRDDNPAGDVLSAARPKTAVRKQHMRALPHAEVAAALARVGGSGAYPGAVLAFEFLVLTAARSGEVRNARWEQIDRDGAVWTIPAERMKPGREHRVPLSPRALEVLDGAAELFDRAGLVFPSPTGRVLNHSALTNVLHGLGIDAVAHGFRSSFRDWAAECTDAPREVCELALAHVNSDRVEAAYRRSDLFDRRRVLMETCSQSLPRYVIENQDLSDSGAVSTDRAGTLRQGLRAVRAPLCG